MSKPHKWLVERDQSTISKFRSVNPLKHNTKWQNIELVIDLNLLLSDLSENLDSDFHYPRRDNCYLKIKNAVYKNLNIKLYITKTSAAIIFVTIVGF